MGLVIHARMQAEYYLSYWRNHTHVAEHSLRGFLADARAQGLTQVHVTAWTPSLVVVIATRPGDRTGKEVMM